MFPAARIGDTITHEMVTPCGMIGPPLPGRLMTVMIEGLPAAVVGDFVTCTGATVAGPAHLPQAGPPPAIPPSVPIVMGSFTVFINFMPAARWIAGMAGCGSFLGDPKLFSNRKVFIGDIAGGGGGGGGAGTGSGGLPAKVNTAYTEGRSSPVGPVPPEHAGPLQPEEEEEEKTWIGIILKDFKGQPMPNQTFQVTLDKGQVLKGRTDEKGYARFNNLDPDSGDVVFSELTDIKDQEQAPEGAGQQPAGALTMDYDNKQLQQSEPEETSGTPPEELFDEDMLFEEED